LTDVFKQEGGQAAQQAAKFVWKFKWAGDQEAVTVSLATSPFDPETDRR
jgi:hypothetical protein